MNMVYWKNMQPEYSQKSSGFTLGNVAAVLVTVAAFGAILLAGCRDNRCLVFDWQKIRAADSFARCAELGFPVTGSYQRQCQAGDKTFSEDNSNAYKIRIASPLPNAVVQSPITVQGDARGMWYFEAQFPVRLLDANGNALASAPARAQGDWMTADPVPFAAALTFTLPSTPTGVLVLEKDNPSGLPENADSVSIPVRFK